MSRRDRLVLLGLAAVALALALVQHATGFGGDALIAAPALLVLLPLAVGRYVGEDGLVRIVRATVRRRRDGTAVPAVRRDPPRAVPRGGLLIAAALARRGPPSYRAAH